MHPFLDRPYDPQVGHFLGGFEIYDCEETLGAELSRYDINNAEDRKELIYKHVIYEKKGTDLFLIDPPLPRR
jgi:hypothetical protein